MGTLYSSSGQVYGTISTHTIIKVQTEDSNPIVIKFSAKTEKYILKSIRLNFIIKLKLKFTKSDLKLNLLKLNTWLNVIYSFISWKILSYSYK